MTNQRFETPEPYEHEGYNPGHPWYYFLGGRPKRLKEILQATRACGYQGYAREDIAAADAMAEPKRSETLRAMRAKFEADLRRDISRYRECVRELRRTDWNSPERQKVAVCSDVQVADRERRLH